MSYYELPPPDDSIMRETYGPVFLIVVTGYNCEKYVTRCLDSIKSQSYKRFCVSILDDGSTDNTGNLGKEFAIHNPVAFFGKRNLKNEGTFYARKSAIENCYSFYDVIVLLDMDDALLPDALAHLSWQYTHCNAWMTYGNYQVENGEKNTVPIHYSDEIHAKRDYRKDQFRCTHLRTFRKELYEKIPAWTLTQSEINSYPDAEILFSMMEMCGKDRIGVIEEPIYLYNTNNPISTLKRFGKDNPGYEEICAREKRLKLNKLK